MHFAAFFYIIPYITNARDLYAVFRRCQRKFVKIREREQIFCQSNWKLRQICSSYCNRIFRISNFEIKEIWMRLSWEWSCKCVFKRIADSDVENSLNVAQICEDVCPKKKGNCVFFFSHDNMCTLSPVWYRWGPNVSLTYQLLRGRRSSANARSPSWSRRTCLTAGKTTWAICTRRAGKLYKARSRLCRSQFLQVNTRWKALAEIYTIHSFAPFSNIKIFV